MRIKKRQKQRGQPYCKGRLGVGTTGQIRVKSLVSVVVKKNMLTEAHVALESLVLVDLKNTTIGVFLLFPTPLSSLLRCGLTSHLWGCEKKDTFTLEVSFSDSFEFCYCATATKTL